MPSAVQDCDATQLDMPLRVLDRDGARDEDTYWARVHSREHYYRPGFHYEDYAPAYCVGYVGFAQYGGCFEDAERSLCANWERIKGDSKLSLDDALPAMRAAWDRMQTRMQVLQAHATSRSRARGRGRSQSAGQPLIASLIQRYLKISRARLPAA